MQKDQFPSSLVWEILNPQETTPLPTTASSTDSHSMVDTGSTPLKRLHSMVPLETSVKEKKQEATSGTIKELHVDQPTTTVVGFLLLTSKVKQL